MRTPMTWKWSVVLAIVVLGWIGASGQYFCVREGARMTAEDQAALPHPERPQTMCLGDTLHFELGRRLKSSVGVDVAALPDGQTGPADQFGRRPIRARRITTASLSRGQRCAMCV